MVGESDVREVYAAAEGEDGGLEEGEKIVLTFAVAVVCEMLG